MKKWKVTRAITGRLLGFVEAYTRRAAVHAAKKKWSGDLEVCEADKP